MGVVKFNIIFLRQFDNKINMIYTFIVLTQSNVEKCFRIGVKIIMIKTLLIY